MSNKQFSVWESAKLGYRLTFRHFGFVLLAAISYGFLYWLIGAITRSFTIFFSHLMRPELLPALRLKYALGIAKSPVEGIIANLGIIDPIGMLKLLWPVFLVSFVFFLIGVIFKIGFFIGLIQIGLDIVDKGKSRISLLWERFGLIGKYIVASLAFGFLFVVAAVFAGLVSAPFYLFAHELVPIVFLIIISILTVYLSARSPFFPLLVVDKQMGGIDSVRESFRITKGHTWKIIGALFLAIPMVFTIVGIPAAYFMLIAIYRKMS